MKRFIAPIATALALAASSVPALAHDSPAKHGGIVRSAGDLSFELVHKDGKIGIHVEDHGKARSVAGAGGKLTVLNGTEKNELPLEAAGGNLLAARGTAKVGPGTKLVAAITFADKSTRSVRFAVK